MTSTNPEEQQEQVSEQLYHPPAGEKLIAGEGLGGIVNAITSVVQSL